MKGTTEMSKRDNSWKAERTHSGADIGGGKGHKSGYGHVGNVILARVEAARGREAVTDAPHNSPGRPLVHSDTFRLPLPLDLRNAIQKGAQRRGMTDSQFVRTAVMTTLMLEGIGTLVSFPDEMTAEQCVEATP
jgi:hypothetical protein